MKSGIHPDHYRTVLFYDSSAAAGWLIRSCAPTTQMMKWTDGQEYPVFLLETSSASHPAYTGKQRKQSSEGRVGKFTQRYGALLNQIKTGKTA